MLLFLTIALPMLGGAAMGLMRFSSAKSRGIYVETIVLATSILTWVLLLTRTDTTYVLCHMNSELALAFRVDGMSCIFAGLVSILWPLASLYGFEYMQHEERPNTFFSYYTMSYAVTLAVAFSANLFSLYVFYECLTLITLPLVIHKKDTMSIRAGRKYLTFSISGAALMTPDGMTGSLSHLVIHGVIKITLFYCAGAILIKTGKEYVQDLRGYSRIMPATCGIFLLGSIALVGTPPLAGFVSKWNLLTAASATGLPMGTVAIVCLIISAILTAIYLFTAALPMYFRPLNADQAQLAGQKLDPSWMMLLPMGILCALMIGLGLWSQPLVTFLRNIAAGVIF